MPRTKTMMTLDGKTVFEIETYALDLVYTVIHNYCGVWYFFGASNDPDEAMRVASSCANPTEIVETATMTEIPPIPLKGGSAPITSCLSTANFVAISLMISKS